jgi:hypothetical protein
MWPAVNKYVNTVKSSKEKPTYKSFNDILNAVNDKTFLTKMFVFESVALHLQPFLKVFRSDVPLAPFLCEQLEKVIRNMLNRFVKPEVIPKTITKLLKLDVENTDNCVSNTKVFLGFKAEQEIREVKVSDREILEIRLGTKSFLSAITANLFKKTALTYTLARSLKCLNPKLITRHVRSPLTASIPGRHAPV